MERDQAGISEVTSKEKNTKPAPWLDGVMDGDTWKMIWMKMIMMMKALHVL